MKNMHCLKHGNNNGHNHGRNHNIKHHAKCQSRHSQQPHIVVPPMNHTPPPEIITVSGIISLNPGRGPSIGGNYIIINGFNLIYTTAVIIEGAGVPFSILSNSQIQIIAPPMSSNYDVDITVQFRNGCSESLPYTYVNGPNIISLNPWSGPITGGNIITITGTGLTHTISVKFNDTVTFNFVVTSDSTIQVVVPNLTGQSNILVRVVTSSSTSNNLSYTLIPAPII